MRSRHMKMKERLARKLLAGESDRGDFLFYLHSRVSADVGDIGTGITGQLLRHFLDADVFRQFDLSE